jgi:hypothetical protein
MADGGIGLGGLASSAQSTIGRYFGVVSTIPSLLMVVFGFLLVRSGAWSGPPQWHAAFAALGHVGFGGATALGVLSIALGLALHPLQFALVQFYEGYWGASPLGRNLAALRIAHHRRRLHELIRGAAKKDTEADRLRRSYPREPKYVLPTRLGNILRHYELLVGQQYGLNVLTILPHLALAAKPEDVRYLDDQRTQLDLAVRLSFTSFLSCAMTMLFLWRRGLWLLIVLIPYFVGYIAYRGALVAAHQYGIAMTALLDLNRFALYERLRLGMPEDIEKEREVNKDLMKLIEAYSKHTPMVYRPPDPPTSTAP